MYCQCKKLYTLNKLINYDQLTLYEVKVKIKHYVYIN